MVRRTLGATVLACAAWSLVACGGQSQSGEGDDSPAGSGGGGSSGAGTGGTGGASSSGGAAGSVAAGTGGTGITPDFACDDGGFRRENGESWQVDCNTCWCKEGSVACTRVGCQPGTGGSSGGGGTGGGGAGGTGTSGMAGEAGSASSCEYADIGSFCVVGNPREVAGVEIVDGMQLGLSLRPAGCYSSSCTKLVSSSCNYIGMNGEYSISPFVCLGTEGDVCTGDCGGGGSPLCYPNLVLHAGTYAITLAGTSLWVKFQVPSVVTNANELCSPIPVAL